MPTIPLFQSVARKRFIAITADRHRNMTVRLAAKNILIPFALDELRGHVLAAMGHEYSGAIRCLYCRRMCDLADIAFDHSIPLARGGSPHLSNISFPCGPCNDQKGEREPWEFEALLVFLETKIPLARIGLLKQLQEHSKLLAGKRKAEMLLRNGGEFPKAKKLGKPPMIAAIEERF